VLNVQVRHKGFTDNKRGKEVLQGKGAFATNLLWEASGVPGGKTHCSIERGGKGKGATWLNRVRRKKEVASKGRFGGGGGEWQEWG